MEHESIDFGVVISSISPSGLKTMRILPLRVGFKQKINFIGKLITDIQLKCRGRRLNTLTRINCMNGIKSNGFNITTLNISILFGYLCLVALCLESQTK